MRTAAWSLVTIVSLFLAMSARDVGAQSVGFFPSAIELESGLRGQRYESITTLVNQTGEPRIFTLAAFGDTAEWTTFSTPDEPDVVLDQVTVPGETEVELVVVIDIPETAPNGDVSGLNAYDGYTQAAFEDREGLVSGFEQPVRIRVTGDQVIALRVGDVSARDAEIGRPLRIQTQLTNNGNVDTAPDLTVEFYRLPYDPQADRALETLETTLEPVRPGRSSTQETEWSTADRQPGRYRADYVLEHDDERLGLGSFEFELLPAGSLSRTGAILAIEVPRPVSANAINRADVTFENTGEVDSLARFEGQVLKDGIAFTVAESPDSLMVRPGEQVQLSAFFQLPGGAEGDYEIRGRVYFEGAQTEEAAAVFTVAGPGDDAIVMAMAVGGGLALVAGTLLVGGAWLSRRR